MPPFESVIRAIAFDLDNTLIDREDAFQRWVADSLQNTRDRNGDLAREIHAFDQQGHGASSEVFESLARNVPSGGDADAWWHRFQQQFPTYFKPETNIHSVLENLRSQGTPLAVLTNGGALLQRGKLNATGLLHHFPPDRVFISEETGFEKPAPEAFQILTNTFNLPPTEILFVGDHPVLDIAGAAACGFQTCWIQNPGYAEPPEKADLIINHLSELENHVLT